jgi:hypothetical protein
VIDGVTSYSTALADMVLYRDFFHAIVGFTKSRLMSTFFNHENSEFLGLSSYMPKFPVNSIVDNIIPLTLVEVNSTLRRCITVVRSRGTKREFVSREYQIGQGEIHLLPAEEGLPLKLPFSHYSSVLKPSSNRTGGATVCPASTRRDSERPGSD